MLFISVLLHELAHSLIAMRYGLKVCQIILFIFGGVLEIDEEEKITKDFRKEFKIAVAGPVTSFVVGSNIRMYMMGCFPTCKYSNSRQHSRAHYGNTRDG